MLAIFHKASAHPPEELNSPVAHNHSRQPKLPEETLEEFLSVHPTNTFSMTFGDAAVLAYVKPDRPYSVNQRLFTAFDDIYCLFMGSLNNLCAQIKQYGLSKNTNEAVFVIEAYRTLRDRGPYPADQVIKDLEGSFAFVVYDSKSGTVFTALGSDGGVKLYWGIAADGSVVISDDLEVIKSGCAKSFAPFPKAPKDSDVHLQESHNLKSSIPQMADRFFPNEFPEFIEEKEPPPAAAETTVNRLISLPYKYNKLSDKLKQAALDLKQTIVMETWGNSGKHLSDYTLYTGALGTAFLVFKAYQITHNKRDLILSKDIIKACDSASFGSRLLYFLFYGSGHQAKWVGLKLVICYTGRNGSGCNDPKFYGLNIKYVLNI